MKAALLLLVLLAPALLANAQVITKSPPIQLFPLSQVRLLDSPFRHAQDTNLAYIMSMDPDRLLAPYLREAGLTPNGENYGNWENTGLDGHIGGHYLTALSLAYSSSGSQAALRRLEYMLGELKRAQDENGDGYLGGVPDGKALWRHVAAGEIDADLFSLNKKWVPWYNLHKVFAGLRDAYLHTGNPMARDMLVKLSDWTLNLVSGLDDQQVQQMLTTEHGGMNEVFADVATITGEERYLDLAQRFSHRSILEPLRQQQDTLTGLHANTQIPKVIGYQRVGNLQGNASWQRAAEFFWDEVVNYRTVAIGGNSVREHFHDRDDFSPMIEDIEGPETCNTYNMLKLTQLLYSRNPDMKYVSYYERALYNHILASQHPDTGGLVYFTPMRPGHYRVYSRPDQAMWCCVGSGIENHSKYGEFIYAHNDDNLFVNLFIPSTLNWQEKRVSLTLTNRIPDAETTTITLHDNAAFTLQLRYPGWVAENDLSIHINGEPQTFAAGPGHYIPIKRQWRAGDQVVINMPMQPRLEQMPDGSDYYALLYGPVVLSARTRHMEGEALEFFADDSRMGHIPSGRLCPLVDAPLLVSDRHNLLQKLDRLPGEELRFSARNVIHQNQQQDLELIPFFRVHESRYMIYWPFTTPRELEQRKQADGSADRERLALQARTIDQVAPGEQQPESDHFFAGEQTRAGTYSGRHWRHALDWFSYRLRDPGHEATQLRITYHGLDRDAVFGLFINSIKLSEVHLDGTEGDQFFTVDYPLPENLWADTNQDILTLRFEARPGSITGKIYGVRLLRD